MAIKFNKESKAIKARTSKPGKLCTLTLVFEIILTVSLGIIAFAPILTGAFGTFLFLVFGAVMIVITIISAGLIWTAEGVRNFFFDPDKGAFAISKKMMDGSTKIIPTLKPYIFAIALPLFFVAAIGFVYNLIYFIKHDKSNKGRFITSCIFLGLAIFNLCFCLGLYLNN